MSYGWKYAINYIFQLYSLFQFVYAIVVTETVHTNWTKWENSMGEIWSQFLSSSKRMLLSWSCSSLLIALSNWEIYCYRYLVKKWWLRFPADSQRISIKSACIETRKWPFCIQIKLYSRWKSEFYAICHKITANVWEYFACGESYRTVWILHVQQKYVYKFSNE